VLVGPSASRFRDMRGGRGSRDATDEAGQGVSHSSHIGLGKRQKAKGSSNSSSEQRQMQTQAREGASKTRSGRLRDWQGRYDDASCFEWLGWHQCANGSCIISAHGGATMVTPFRTLHINKPPGQSSVLFPSFFLAFTKPSLSKILCTGTVRG
jgi:hypothetical protein